MKPVEIVGYASLFGAVDLVGDVVRRGAFRRSLAQRGPPPMWLAHAPHLRLGRWSSAEEDGRGLFVRGTIDPKSPGAGEALRQMASGLDGLSIGFSVVHAVPRSAGGRELIDLDLWEVSLVAVPMSPPARFWRVDQPVLHI